MIKWLTISLGKYARWAVTPLFTDRLLIQRHRMLLSMLGGLAVLDALMLGFEFAQLAAGDADRREAIFTIWTCVGTIILFAGIVVLARVRIRAAVWLLLALTTAPNFFTEAPREMLFGNSMFFLCIPVFLSGVLLSARGCVTYVALLIGTLVVFGLVTGAGVNWVVLLVFVGLGTLAYLFADRLEKAMRGLIVLIDSLEGRMAERIAELAEMNATFEARVIERTAQIAQTSAQQARMQEQVIEAQQALIQELQAPVERVWDGVVSMSLIGAVDSTRARNIIQSLLTGIERHGARVAVISVSGVPTIDTATAGAIIRAVQAARLLGCMCVLVGVRPDVAATMIELGLDMGSIETKGAVQDALAWALAQLGQQVVEAGQMALPTALRALIGEGSGP